MSPRSGPSGIDFASLVSSGMLESMFASQQQQLQHNGLAHHVRQSGPVHSPPRGSHAVQPPQQQQTDASEQLKSLVMLLGMNGSLSSGRERGQAPPADRPAPPEHSKAGSALVATSETQNITRVELDTAALLSSLAASTVDPTHRQSAAAAQGQLVASPPKYGGYCSRGGVGTSNLGAEDTADDIDSEDTGTGGSVGRGNRKRELDGGGNADKARRLKRMAKNRATAAASRERKKALFDQLTARVAVLETKNQRLQQDLLLKDLEGEVFRELLRTFSLTRRQPVGGGKGIESSGAGVAPNSGAAHAGDGGAPNGGGGAGNEGCLSQ